MFHFIFTFGFKSRICLLIAPVPVHCFSIIFFKMAYGHHFIDLLQWGGT